MLNMACIVIHEHVCLSLLDLLKTSCGTNMHLFLGEGDRKKVPNMAGVLICEQSVQACQTLLDWLKTIHT